MPRKRDGPPSPLYAQNWPRKNKRRPTPRRRGLRPTRGVTRPNIVVCTTAHAAFDKAGQYFGVQVRKARPTPDTLEIDLAHVRRLMDANTVALVGSAPQYPYGTVDDIEELGRLAAKTGVGLHVDCCLGGFLLPFMEEAGYPLPKPCDFRVGGVTTISCDPHKYGFAPKGTCGWW